MARSGVLLTRLLPPRLPPACVDRPDLRERVTAGMRGRLVTVLAGAGYGKSTLVAQALLAQSTVTVWVSCDERLGGAPDLVAHISAGIERVIPGFGTRLRIEGTVTQQVTALCNEVVATVSDDLVLVLDDVHLLDEEANRVLAGLLHDLPPSVHLVLAGRAPLAFPLGKVRAGQLVAVTERDLALDEGEVAAVWRSEGGADDTEIVRRVHLRTEGWVAGVVLAAQAGGPDIDRRVDTAHLFDYLAEEVFLAQPRDVQDFILQTSVLERFSPELAGRVVDIADARPLCRALVERHMFTVRIDADGEWYRYHHLFQAFLRARLEEVEPALVPELHRRAAEAWLATGERPAAVEHLLAAGDFEVAAEIIESLADDMRLSPQSRVLNRWIESLPEDLHAGRPALRLARSIYTFAQGEHEEGFALLDRVIDDLLAAGDREKAADAFYMLIYGQMISGTRQRYAIDVGYRHLPRIDESVKLLPAVMVLMASELGCATRYDEADEVLGDVLRLRMPTIDPLGPGYLASTRALFMDHPRGHTKKALETMDWVIDLFARHARFDTLGYILALRCYRAILLNQLGRYDETLVEVDRIVDDAMRRGITGGADRMLTKLRAVALAGLERWTSVEEVLARSESFEQMRGSSYAFRTMAPAARLAAHNRDTELVGRYARSVIDYVDAFGFSFDTPGWICDVAASAFQVGLLDDARRLQQEVLVGAERAESPWTMARGQLLGAAVLEGQAADQALADALEITGEWDFAEIWTRRDRRLAAATLGRAVVGDLGPSGRAAALAVRAGAEVLDGCADAVATGPQAARRRLLHAMDEAGVAEPDIRERLQAPGSPPSTRRPTPVTVARPPLRISALGGFTVRRGEEIVPVSAFGRERARALLGVLVCSDGPVHRERLLDLLWPDLDVDRGVRALHVTLHGLRRALEPELGRGAASRSVIRSEGEGYRLVLADADTTDIDEFLALATPDPADTPRRELTRLLAAERAHTGPVYPEWPYADWAADRRREVDAAFCHVLLALGARYLADGAPGEAILRYERLVALEPEREEFHRRLMGTYSIAGEKALALRQYHACRATLRRELGVEASPETRALYQLILDDQPLPAPDAPAALSRK